MHVLSKSALIACAALGPAALPAFDAPAFHPADGSRAAKSFAIKGDLTLGEVTIIVDSVDIGQQLALDISGKFAAELVVVDNYVKSAEGRPLELVRDFRSSKGSFDMKNDHKTTENVLELDGKSVAFKWNAEKRDYDRTLVGEAQPDARLDGLGVDLDYLGLLPGRQVAPGERWEVGSDALATALFLGMDLQQAGKLLGSDGEFADLRDSVTPQLEKLGQAFKAQCEYAGTREVDGVHVGVIKVRIDSKGSADLAAAMMGAIKTDALGEDVEIDLESALLDAQVKGEGELLWDLAAGRAHAFTLQCDVELDIDIKASAKTSDGQAHTAALQAELMAEVLWTMKRG